MARGLADAAPKAVVWLGPGACMHVRGAYSARYMAVNRPIGTAIAMAMMLIKSVPAKTGMAPNAPVAATCAATPWAWAWTARAASPSTWCCRP